MSGGDNAEMEAEEQAAGWANGSEVIRGAEPWMPWSEVESKVSEYPNLGRRGAPEKRGGFRGECGRVMSGSHGDSES